MDELFIGAYTICSSPGAFVAVNSVGDLFTWTSPGSTIVRGDYPASTGDMKLIALRVDKAFCSRGSYAAIGTDASASSWPTTEAWFGGDSGSVASKLRSGIVDIFMNQYAFAALTDKGGLVVWGNMERGGDSSSAFQRPTVVRNPSVSFFRRGRPAHVGRRQRFLHLYGFCCFEAGGASGDVGASRSWRRRSERRRAASHVRCCENLLERVGFRRAEGRWLVAHVGLCGGWRRRFKRRRVRALGRRRRRFHCRALWLGGAEV